MSETLKKATAILEYTPDLKRVAAAFSATDDIGVMIRCHFETEKAVDHVLGGLTAGRFDRTNRAYQYLGPKLDLLKLLGVPAERVEPLRKINALRNRFAHDGQDVIDPGSEEQLRREVAKVFPIVNDPKLRVMIDPGTPIGGKNYRDCKTSERYVVLTIYAVAAIITLLNARAGPSATTPATPSPPKSPSEPSSR
jgi:hypothetical protein